MDFDWNTHPPGVGTEDDMSEIAGWILASIAWVSAILIIASIDSIKDLDYRHRIGDAVPSKSKRR
jgi:hypothetical protein